MEELVVEKLSLPATYAQKLTPEVARKIDNLKSTIDIHNKGKVIAYGREEQASIGKFYDCILQGIGTTEVGEAGELLTRVIGDIKDYKVACDKENTGIFAFFKRRESKIQTLQDKYRFLSNNIDIVVKELQDKDLALGKISRNFDIMYEQNLSMYEFLTMIIYAGEQAIQEEKQKLALVKQKAEASGDSMEAQKASDFNEDIVKFERRLYDLKLTRTISMQQARQIRNIQKSAEELSESIKTTIVNTIPLWKSQMAIALGMQIVKEGLNAVNAVKDASNIIIIANSEKNKQLTLDVAKAATQRGFIDIDTINVVNQNLIDSLSGAYEIVQKAITSREEGAKQLRDNEAELKNAIVNI